MNTIGGLCEHTNETLCPTNGCECVDQIRDRYPLNKRIFTDPSLRSALSLSQLYSCRISVFGLAIVFQDIFYLMIQLHNNLVDE